MTKKTGFFEEWSWFKFNNFGLALDKNLKFYTSVEKGVELKFRKIWGLVPTFVEVTREKLVHWAFLASSLPSPASRIGLKKSPQQSKLFEQLT